MSEVTSVNGQTGAVVLTATNVEAIPNSKAGKPEGVATLNGSGELPTSQLPPSVITGSHFVEHEGNIAIGTSLSDVTTGTNNTAYGVGALGDITTGSSNVAIGGSALAVAKEASANIAVGEKALASNNKGNF